MGMESYFFHLLPLTVHPIQVEIDHGLTALDFHGRSLIESEMIIRTLQGFFKENKVPFKWISEFEKFEVDNVLEVEISEEGSFFKKATLIGVFSCYDQGLKISYQISRVINSIIKVQIYHPLKGLEPLPEEDSFYNLIKFIYKDKYGEFIRIFGEIKGKSLPNKKFYKFYRRKKFLDGLIGEILRMVRK